MATINTGSVIDDFVQNLIEILRLKQSTWNIVEFYPSDISVYFQLPAITVNFTQGQEYEGGRAREIVELSADVSYYHSEFNESYQKQVVDQRIWDLKQWLKTHQTVNGWGYQLIVDDFGHFTRLRGNSMIGGGIVKVRGFKNGIDITDVS